MRLNHNTKEQALAGMRLLGTRKAGALAANITIEALNEEIKKSMVYRKRANEALQEGKSNLGDTQLQFINDVAEGKIEVKMPRLVAALALANWSVEGFKGKTTVQGKIDHDIRVISAVPRPKYEVDNHPRKMLQSEIRDEKGLIAVQSVEGAIEGEIVNG